MFEIPIEIKDKEIQYHRGDFGYLDNNAHVSFIFWQDILKEEAETKNYEYTDVIIRKLEKVINIDSFIASINERRSEYENSLNKLISQKIEKF